MKKKAGAKQDWTQKYDTHRTGPLAKTVGMGSRLRERDCSGRHDYQYDRPYTAVRDADFLQVGSSDMEVPSALHAERVFLRLSRVGEVLNDREKELLNLKCSAPVFFCFSSVRCVLVLGGLDVMNEQGKAPRCACLRLATSECCRTGLLRLLRVSNAVNGRTRVHSLCSGNSPKVWSECQAPALLLSFTPSTG